MPPGLLVCRAVAADLQDRLQHYAAVRPVLCATGCPSVLGPQPLLAAAVCTATHCPPVCLSGCPYLAPLQGQKLSLGGTFSAGALVSSVGKWLDRGLTAMMGGGSDAGEPGIGCRLPSSACGRHQNPPGCNSSALLLK